MSILSFEFLLFFVITAGIYFCVSGKYQWIVLLCASILFVWKNSGILQMIIMAVFVSVNYFAALRIEIYGRKNSKISVKRKQMIFWVTVVFDIMLLVLLVDNQLVKAIVERICHQELNLHGIAPMGMSYFSLIILGYVIDVYWGKYQAQKNLGKVALFAFFFPQMVSGPFVRYSTQSNKFSSGEGDKKHSFSYENFTFGLQRILWGIFKKLVIAERCAIIVNAVYSDYTSYDGTYILLAVFAFVLQLYTDFSGLMDIVIGISEILGIELPENFNTPFYSTSLSEFWRRWHITLGAWLQEYVFYPLLRTTMWRNFKKWCKKHFGKDYEKKFNLPLYAGLFVSWFLIGYWHGGSLNYVFGVGLFMWGVIVSGELLKPFFKWLLKILQINTKCFSWRMFQRIRTFFLFAVGLSFFRSDSVRSGLQLWKAMFSSSNLSVLYDGSIWNLGLGKADAVIGVIALFVLLMISKLQQNGSVRKQIAGQNMVFRWGIWMLLCISILLFGIYGTGLSSAGFIYGGF